MDIWKEITNKLNGRRDAWSNVRTWGYDLSVVWGVRFIPYYFCQIHLFDILRGTDTMSAITRDKYTDIRSSFDDGTFYFPCSTSEVVHSFDFVKRMLGAEFDKYSFVDIGCGKGKAVLIWEEQLNKKRIHGQAFGIDYFDQVVAAARRNHNIMFGDDGKFSVEDAAICDYEKFGTNIIAFLYNPFGERVLRSVLSRLSSMNAVIIYNNPKHEEIFRDSQFRLVYKKDGWHPSKCTRIFVHK